MLKLAPFASVRITALPTVPVGDSNNFMGARKGYIYSERIAAK